jgi:hypothetical protein
VLFLFVLRLRAGDFLNCPLALRGAFLAKSDKRLLVFAETERLRLDAGDLALLRLRDVVVERRDLAIVISSALLQKMLLSDILTTYFIGFQINNFFHHLMSS